jgi:copper homeostasis protein
MLLEVIVTTLADALAAERGGAGRLELVRDLARGGMTPDPALVEAVTARVGIPVRVMVRETESHAVTDAPTLERLRDQARRIARLPVDGLVLGFAREGRPDLDATAHVLSGAPGLRATFHRAFDEVTDQAAGLTALAQLPQIDRVLLSGGTGDWTTGVPRLAGLAALAPRGITLIAGYGVEAGAIAALQAARVLCEVHVGRAARKPPVQEAPVDDACVRELADLCRGA